MGPTQSAVAWPGCDEERRDHQDGLPTKQRGQPKPTMTGHQTDKLAHEQHLAAQAPFPDTADHDDSHHVSVNPVYEFALCRKIKETFSKGDTTSERNSQIELEERRASSVLAEDDDDGGGDWSTSVVSVQPQSLAPSVVTENEPETGQSDQEHNDDSTVTTKHAELVEPESSEPQIESQARPKINEANNIVQDQTKITDKSDPPQGRNEDTETTPLDQQDQTVATSNPKPLILTESKGTQTTPPPPHTGDFTLAPPPPRHLMNSVSTPPDETSPGIFYKFSQQTHTGGGFLTDDITLSSPDFESDASDAGHVHLRGRFGSGGATAAGAAASGTSESASTPEGVRRKRSKKKEEKTIEYVLRQMHSLGSPQEKLTALCRKYTDLHEEQKGLQAVLKQHQRKMNVILREKDQLQTEHNHAVMKKCKLETLCRELQKQNKAVKDESLLRAKEEEEKRKQMSAKFQTSITEIQKKVNDNHEQNVKLHEENQALSRRLKCLVERHQDKEEQLDQVVCHHRDLELRLAQTRLQQASATLREEQELHLREKEKILLQATEGRNKNYFLEAELNKYKERYEEFQDTIDKSGLMFQHLKSDIDRMGKRIKKLEKDGEEWKNKWETSNKALHEATDEKSKCEKANNTLQTKVTKLESLCRALQGQLHQASKTTNISKDPCTAEAASSPSSDDTTTPATTPTTSVRTSTTEAS